MGTTYTTDINNLIDIFIYNNYFPLIKDQDLKWFSQQNIGIKEVPSDTLLIWDGKQQWVSISDLKLKVVQLEFPKIENEDRYRKVFQLQEDLEVTSSSQRILKGYILKYHNLQFFKVSMHPSYEKEKKLEFYYDHC